jgi:hypothetical protein
MDSLFHDGPSLKDSQEEDRFLPFSIKEPAFDGIARLGKITALLSSMNSSMRQYCRRRNLKAILMKFSDFCFFNLRLILLYLLK